MGARATPSLWRICSAGEGWSVPARHLSRGRERRRTAPVRHPPRLTWLIIGGVAALLVVAVADALRSESENARSEATASSTNEASPTTTTSTTVEGEGSGTSRAVRRPSLDDWHEIAQTGNEWARLFAAGGRACKHMTQPACERMACERVGARPIANCTPPSLAFRRSFADATVAVVAIEGEQASVKFTNGKVVLLVNVGAGVWWIHKFAGGGSARPS